jgi:hypothetical protein
MPQWGPPSTGQGQPRVAGAARQGFGWALGCLVFAVGVGIVLVVLAFIGLSAAVPSERVPSAPPATAPTSIVASGTPAILPGRSPVTASGSGASASDTLRLVGDYSVTWTAQSTDVAGCFISATLERTDGVYTGLRLARDRYDSTALHSGSSNLYGLGGGAQYYVDETGGCTWSFTFTPR